MYTLNKANRNRSKLKGWTRIWQCYGISDEMIVLVSERVSLCVLGMIENKLVSLWLGVWLGELAWFIDWFIDW